MSLTPDDIVDGGYLVVDRLKGSRKTTQPLLANEKDGLLELVAKTAPGRPLFPVSRWTVRRRLQEYGEIARVPLFKCHPHVLKHTCGRLGFKGGMSVTELVAYLGHEPRELTTVCRERRADSVQCVRGGDRRMTTSAKTNQPKKARPKHKGSTETPQSMLRSASTDDQRLLAEFDKQIAAARQRLDQLIAAREILAGRTSVPAQSGRMGFSSEEGKQIIVLANHLKRLRKEGDKEEIRRIETRIAELRASIAERKRAKFRI